MTVVQPEPSLEETVNVVEEPETPVVDEEIEQPVVDEVDEVEDGSPTEPEEATKEQNRLGYQLRQIRTNDEYVSKLRTNLQDNYVSAEGLTPEQSQIRKLEADAYIKDVEQARAQIVSDNQKVSQEISIFNPKSKDFNKELLDRSLTRYARDHLVRDEQTGEILGYKMPLAEYMHEEADTYLAGRNTVQKKRATATAQMEAAAEEPGGTSTARAEAKEDPMEKAFLDGFNSVR